GPAIIASTVTTLVIFLPLAFVRGVSGVLFVDLALVIAFALACSLLVSLSLVPMLAAKLLGASTGGASTPGEAPARAGWVQRLLGAADRGSQSLVDGYARMLAWALTHR